jgi:hypothetical protein
MGPIPPGEWHTWQFFCRTGATSRVKLTRAESVARRGAACVPRSERAAGVPVRAAVSMRAAAHENARERRQRRGSGFRGDGPVGSMRFLRGRVADSMARVGRRGKGTGGGRRWRRQERCGPRGADGGIVARRNTEERRLHSGSGAPLVRYAHACCPAVPFDDSAWRCVPLAGLSARLNVRLHYLQSNAVAPMPWPMGQVVGALGDIPLASTVGARD